MIKLEAAVCLEREATLTTGSGGSISIGEATSIGMRSELSAYLSDIRIGRNSMLASDCKVFTHNHGTLPGMSMQRQGMTTKGDVVIGNDVWVGSGAIILSGVQIGDGAVVGAGAIVTKNVPAHAVAVGNPAHVVKYRGMPSPARLSPSVEFDAVMLRAPDGTIQFWNRGAERLYGWPASDTVGKRSHHLLKTLFPQPLPTIEQELWSTGHWEGQLIHIRRDGSRMAVLSRWELRYDEDNSDPIVLEVNYPPHVA